MKTSIPSKRTEGQETKYRRLVEDSAKHAIDLALGKTEADQDGWQRILEHGDELRGSIAEIVVAKTRELSLSSQFANEEVRSSYVYPKEYNGPKSIEEQQIKEIAKIFGLDPSNALEFAKNLSALPDDAERWFGWFAIPSVDALAVRQFPEVTDPAEKYCRALQLIHQKIAESRSFTNWRDGQINTAHLRVSARTLEAMNKIAETQKGDILIIAAQLGMRHRGRSIRRAREVFVQNEFGLTSVAVGSIALTHPERFVRYKELGIDCAGDKFSDDGDDSFGRAPCFGFGGGEVEFDTELVSVAHDGYGSASLLFPQ